VNLESIKNLGDIHHFTRILINIIYCLSSFIWGFLNLKSQNKKDKKN
jgi:hypothetical protein